jgi:hypothetical protein
MKSFFSTSTLMISVCCLVAAAATKQRDWKTARVLDSSSDLSSYVTGSSTTTNSSGTATGNSTTTTTSPVPGMATSNTMGNATVQGQSTSYSTIHRVTIQSNQLVLAAEGYLYVISDQRMTSGPLLRKALANRKHGCRFVVGEDVKYSQDKGDLYILDADEKECKSPILRQEKRQ